MLYVPYADEVYYKQVFGGTGIPEDSVLRKLKDASRHIDSLTFNRILAKGFENLTGFQQEIIRETVCRQAEFEYGNQEFIETILTSYSINGVNMSFENGWNVHIEKGVAVKSDTYALLSQSGLTDRLAVR